MLKKSVCSMALGAALILLVQSALAQNYSGPPKTNIQAYGPFTSSTTAPSKPVSEVSGAVAGAGAGTCGNPAAKCLFYGGNFSDNPLGPPSLPNALANETTALITGTPYGAATWVPFTVPAGQTWAVTGLFTNNLAAFGVLDQSPIEPVAAAFWSINEDVAAGSAGTVVASGTSAATSTATGRGAFGLQEYTVQVTGLSFDLTSGSYWLAVVPLCTNTADPFCDGVWFESDVEYVNLTPTNAFGPAEPVDAAFFDSPFFSLSFDPANSAVGACGGFGCDAFSAGVLGSKVK